MAGGILGIAAVVEDNVPFQKAVVSYLKGQGFSDVYGFTYGKEFLEFFRRKADDLGFVLLDMLLPDILGHDILTIIRNRSEYLPVMIITAYFEEKFYRSTFNRGVDYFLPKPTSVFSLGSAVRRLLDLVYGPKNRKPKTVLGERFQFVKESRALVDLKTNRQVYLTPKETLVFRTLLRYGNSVVPYALFTLGRKELNKNTLQVLVFRLNSKLKKFTKNRIAIKAVYGGGYRLLVKNDSGS